MPQTAAAAHIRLPLCRGLPTPGSGPPTAEVLVAFARSAPAGRPAGRPAHRRRTLPLSFETAPGPYLTSAKASHNYNRFLRQWLQGLLFSSLHNMRLSHLPAPVLEWGRLGDRRPRRVGKSRVKKGCRLSLRTLARGEGCARGLERGLRHLRGLRPGGRRRPAHLLRAVRPPAPGAGERGHSHGRWGAHIPAHGDGYGGPGLRRDGPPESA